MTRLLRATLSAGKWIACEIIKLTAAIIVALFIVWLLRGAHAEHATYYADRFEGHRMANGERFHQRAITVAHPHWPLGTLLSLCNPENGACIRVPVTDRPARRVRGPDLSKGAFRALGGELRRGTVPVVEEVAEVPMGRKK